MANLKGQLVVRCAVAPMRLSASPPFSHDDRRPALEGEREMLTFDFPRVTGIFQGKRFRGALFTTSQAAPQFTFLLVIIYVVAQQMWRSGRRARRPPGERGVMPGARCSSM